MKLRSPWILRSLALLAAWLIRCWMGTLRYRMFFAGPERHPADPRRQRYLYAFWHETILFPTAFRTPIQVLISQHADGELIAQVCRFLGFGAVRGSSTRGGVGAVVQMCHTSQVGHLGVTPDGPRGPRRRVQLGLIYLASVTGLPIVAFGVGYSRAWRARSWDRFAVPWPWSTATCVIAPAIRVPAGLTRPELERYRRLIEEQLLSVTAAAERWAQDGAHPSMYEARNMAPDRKAVA